MLRRITLENFMSHAHTIIDLAEGLTVLVGPNNCGKSAVIEALRTVCTNLPAEVLVRHGEREARISIETDDGHTVVWRRKGSTVSYVIDGREIHRLKGTVPDDLHEVLRLPKVTTPQGDTFDIHFALQKSPMFLIDESGSKAAGFFSTSSDAEKLMQMQQRHREKVRNAKARHKDINGELQRLSAQLEALSAVEQLSSTMEQLEREHAGIGEENQQIALLSALLRRMENAHTTRDRHAAQWAILSEIQSPPALEDARPLAQLIDRLNATKHAVQRENAMDRALADLAPPPLLADTAPLHFLVSSLDRAHHTVAYRAACNQSTADLEKPPALDDEAPLAALCDRLAAIQHRVKHLAAAATSLALLTEPPTIDEIAFLQSCIEAMGTALQARNDAVARYAASGPLEAPPELDDLTLLQALIDQWDANRRRAARHAVDICEIDDQLAEVEQQIRAWAAAHPMCPVCGSSVDAERILAQEHTHA